MEGARARGGVSQQMLARVAMVAAAAVIVMAFFLPWSTAGEAFREGAQAVPETVFYEPTGMTVADAVDLSLFEYAQVYASMGSGWMVYAGIMYAVLGTSALALLLAALGRPIGSAVFAILAFAGSRLLVWDFGDRGILPNGTHDWGVAATVYVVAFVVLLAAAIWMFVLRRRARTGACEMKTSE